MKKTLITALSILMVVLMTVGGTVAYLTDRDSTSNVFTLGNVDIELNENFEQGATLLPGVNINKIPTIINTGNTDAWVWLTFSIPSALDNWNPGTEQGSNLNVIHWNPLGATTQGYVDDTRVQNAIDKGLLPDDITADDINNNNMTWNVFNDFVSGENCYTEVINGVNYNTYVIAYNKAIEPGEETLPSLYNVFLDATVDIDPEGNWHKVVGGQVTDLDWNSQEDGAPVLYIAAYGIQAPQFATVKDAYNAYVGQWGQLNAVHNVVSQVNTADELAAALAKGGDIYVNDDIVMSTYAKVDAAVEVNLYIGDNTISRDPETGGTGIYVNNEDAVVNIYGGNVTAKGEAIYVNAGTVNIYGGWFEGLQGAYTTGTGIINIYGGTFVGVGEHQGTLWTLNKLDSARATSQINVYGGDFLNFNPADNSAEGAHTDFVADGYRVDSYDMGDGDVWYTVVAE